MVDPVETISNVTSAARVLLIKAERIRSSSDSKCWNCDRTHAFEPYNEESTLICAASTFMGNREGDTDLNISEIIDRNLNQLKDHMCFSMIRSGSPLPSAGRISKDINRDFRTDSSGTIKEHFSGRNSEALDCEIEQNNFLSLEHWSENMIDFAAGFVAHTRLAMLYYSRCNEYNCSTSSKQRVDVDKSGTDCSYTSIKSSSFANHSAADNIHQGWSDNTNLQRLVESDMNKAEAAAAVALKIHHIVFHQLEFNELSKADNNLSHNYPPYDNPQYYPPHNYPNLLALNKVLNKMICDKKLRRTDILERNLYRAQQLGNNSEYDNDGLNFTNSSRNSNLNSCDIVSNRTEETIRNPSGVRDDSVIENVNYAECNDSLVSPKTICNPSKATKLFYSKKQLIEIKYSSPQNCISNNGNNNYSDMKNNNDIKNKNKTVPVKNKVRVSFCEKKSEVHLYSNDTIEDEKVENVETREFHRNRKNDLNNIRNNGNNGNIVNKGVSAFNSKIPSDEDRFNSNRSPIKGKSVDVTDANRDEHDHDNKEYRCMELRKPFEGGLEVQVEVEGSEMEEDVSRGEMSEADRSMYTAGDRTDGDNGMDENGNENENGRFDILDNMNVSLHEFLNNDSGNYGDTNDGNRHDNNGENIRDNAEYKYEEGDESSFTECSICHGYGIYEIKPEPLNSFTGNPILTAPDCNVSTDKYKKREKEKEKEADEGEEIDNLNEKDVSMSMASRDSVALTAGDLRVRVVTPTAKKIGNKKDRRNAARLEKFGNPKSSA